MESLPKLVVGLGNPTASYDHTRHNVGKRFVEQALSGEIPGRVLPSYMNQSGPALRSILQNENIPITETLIIVDDFMIPFGTFRLRTKGSSGGQNGLNSIIEAFSSEEFPRLRVGIGPVPPGQDPADFVLEKFTKAEEKELPSIFDRINAGLAILFKDGYSKAMNELNK